MGVRFLDLKKQYTLLKPRIDEAIASVIADSAFIGGPYVERFEREFAGYSGADYCVGCANGTDAIEICLEALALPAGSEVIVPANTFIATSEAVSRAGLNVVFCDIRSDDYTLCPDSLRSKIGPKTSAVIPVHLYGQPCAMDRIVEIANTHGLKIIEDCAQAHGAEFAGTRVGNFGACGTFSFYPGKNLGAYGDAGAIVTNDGQLAKRIRMIGNHGRTQKYDHEFEGRNSRLDGIQAAVLSVKLGELDKWIEQRQNIAARYYEGLCGVGDLVLPAQRNATKHVYHLFVVRTMRRDELQSFLKSRGIETGIHYPIALPKLLAYQRVSNAVDALVACENDGKILSLPIGDHMDMEATNEVIEACIEFFV